MQPLLPDVAKIAVLRANALGDLVFSLPALQALRAAYPAAEIVLLGAEWHRRFLADRPGPVDRVLVVPAPPGPGAPDPRAPDAGAPDGGAAAAFLAAARRERFDIAVQLHGGGRYSNPFVRALGARLCVGLRAADASTLDRWVRYVFYQPEVFRYLEVVGLVGAAPVTYEPAICVTGADRGESEAVVGAAARPRVALHPGATDPRRRWPPERFAAVGDALAAAGAEVFVTGTGPERRVVAGVADRMRAPARALVGELSLGGLAGLYAGCALVVANDTGPLHLAAAVGTRTVGLYWVGNLINGAPVYRRRHRALAAWTIHCPECGADTTRDLYPARGGGDGCAHRPSFVADIPVAEVVHDAVELLADSCRGPSGTDPFVGNAPG